jgi:hypothetical protein
MTVVAGSSNQPTPLHPHGFDNPADGEACPSTQRCIFEPHSVALSRRSFY